MTIPLSTDLFRDFLHCQFKAHLRVSGTSGKRSNYQHLQEALERNYHSRARDRLIASQANATLVEMPHSLAQAMQQGHGLILDATVASDRLLIHFDALVRVATRVSASAPAYYPVMFLHRKKLTKDDSLLLALQAVTIKDLTRHIPGTATILHGDDFKRARFHMPPLVHRTNASLAALALLYNSGTPPPLRLNAHCSICEFKEACYAEAKSKDDLSLLRGLAEKDITALHNKGIFTITQYSYTFRPRKTRKGMGTPARKHNHALQSRAIRDNTLYIADKPVLPSAQTSLYLDVEGLPDEEFYYLIGLFISDGTSQVFHSFWADNKEQERSNWHGFLEAVNKVNGDFAVLHYGRYEVNFLKQMRGRYGGDSNLLDAIDASTFNVLTAIHSHLYFPVLSNDLKSIASSMGFRWSMSDASGLESIVWHHQWAGSGDPAVKQKLLQYNKEDCLALEAVMSVLRAVCDDSITSHPMGFSQIVRASDVKPEGAYRFQKQQFFFPELAQINKCAYFDYQRDKVYLRTKKQRGKSHSRRNNGNRKKYRVNKVIEHPKPMKCSACGSEDLKSQTRYQKDILDLRFFKGGVKAWNERHIARPYKCQSCGQVLSPEEYLSIGGVHRRGRARYGPNLCIWCVYNKVALGQSLGRIVGGLENIFGLRFDRGIAERAMQRASEQYRDTYLILCDRLLAGQLVHADETWVSITGRHGGRGYVWAFANMENVVYKFSLTREATTPKTMLGTFAGVLVSDFYSAYDSLECVQQKCLIHLIRDMNKDVFKYPFDEECKRIVHGFGVLLRAIVETIDRYGLTRRHLHKHQKDVNRFYREVVSVEYRSELARRYQRRLARWRENLFVFLDRDGIPWNNNNGENAVKTFVLRRKLIGAFAEDRIEGYLILLSIFQTLRYRGISFLEFLQSGETDIDRFCARRGASPS